MNKFLACLVVAMCLEGGAVAAENKTDQATSVVGGGKNISALSNLTIKPGRYVTEGNWGELMITGATKAVPMKFSISKLGANGHICELAGNVINDKGTAEEEGVTESKCVFNLKMQADRVSVVVDESYDNACRYYCGARAWFAGDYFYPIPLCEESRRVRDEFAHAYQEKKYKDAREILNNLLNKCESFLYWHDKAEVRNDLAITEFHLGNKAACLKSLEPLKSEYVLEDPPYFTPIDQDWGEEMVKITRFNWKKCGGVFPEYKAESN